MIKNAIKTLFFTRDLNWFSVIGILVAYELFVNSVLYAALTLVAFAVANLFIESLLD